MYTVFGGNGFIGSEIVKSLRRDNINVFVPERDYICDANKNLGHVIYCIGLTADFRSRPFDTIEAHVSFLNKIIKYSKFDSFVYLSSTRVYKRLSSVEAFEEVDISVNPNDPDDLYNISKLMGESICLSAGNNNIKVVRLSNVIGADYSNENFLTTLIREAKLHKKIELKTAIESSKDYVFISDVVDILKKIHAGNKQIYNLATGVNISTKELLQEMEKHIEFTLIESSTQEFKFPKISIKSLEMEFDFKPLNVISQLELIIKQYK